MQEREQLVAHLFRSEYGKLVSYITRIFGPAKMQLAEDIVQDTLIAALEHWAIEGMPENPAGWLVQVAKRKALNELKRNKMMQAHYKSDIPGEPFGNEPDPVFLKSEIEDSQLRMIFTCCHPSLSMESQIALTLKTLCGFGIKEVANALLASESTINKRLYRAKESLRNSKTEFDIPQGKELERRLEAVSLTLYLLFNEGYNSTVNDALIRKELCLEAMRLTKLLANRFPEQRKLYALLALMSLHAARFDARIDDNGAIVVLEDQHRSRWNRELINAGMQYLQKAGGGNSLSAYHIEAAIAAEHCIATNFETTNWESIYQLYLLLEKIKPNPIIQLNLAIIQSRISGIASSLALLKELEGIPTLKNYYLIPATKGIFYIKLQDFEMAVVFLSEALGLKPPPQVRDFIINKINECKRRN